MVSQPPRNNVGIPVYALSRSGTPLIAASLHPSGAKVAVTRARKAGVEVSTDGKLVDGEWLRDEFRERWPDMVPTLSALLIAVVQQGILLNEVQQIRKGDPPGSIN